jgi:hypothetical protein
MPLDDVHLIETNVRNLDETERFCTAPQIHNPFRKI